MNYRKHINHVFHSFAQSLGMNRMEAENFAPKNFDCLRMMVDTYTEKCGAFNDYEMKFGSYLVAACEQFGNVDGNTIKD